MDGELLAVNAELRSLGDKIADGSIKGDEAKLQLENLRTQKREIEQRIAAASAPKTTIAGGGEERAVDFAAVRTAMIEKRSIVLNDTGKHSQINQLLMDMQRRTDVLRDITYYMGPNALTSVPLLSPTIAVPDPHAEGATNVPVDTQAMMANRVLRPRAFISILPVSAETLAMGSIDFERELPRIFGKAFAQGFAQQVLTGDGLGNNFLGIFPGAGRFVNCQMAGVPRVMDIVGLAMEIRDFSVDKAVIIMSNQTYTGIQGDATAGVAEKYKEILIREKRIENVPVLVTGFAPSSVVSGSTVAMACDLGDYGMAMAGEIKIDPIQQVGTLKTFFQASIFANGAPMVPQNFIGLRTI